MYSYKLVSSGKLHEVKHEDLDAIYPLASDLLHKLNINFDPEDLANQIARQNKFQKKEKRKLSIREAFQGAKAILRLTIGNSASAQEIQRRSAICDVCPLKMSTGGCVPCGAAKKVADVVALVQRTKKTPMAIPDSVKSKYCDVCGCALAVMIPTKYLDFDPESPEKNQRRPDNCWLKITSPNLTHE